MIISKKDKHMCRWCLKPRFVVNSIEHRNFETNICTGCLLGEMIKNVSLENFRRVRECENCDEVLPVSYIIGYFFCKKCKMQMAEEIVEFLEKSCL